MTKEIALSSCKEFDVESATLSMWTLKKRPNAEFASKSIDVTETLIAELKSIVSKSLALYTEVDDYTLLSQPSESGCLHVGVDETSFADLKALVDRPAEECRIQSNRDMKGVAGYVIRLSNDHDVLYCVKQVPGDWRTKKALSVINVVLRANQLELVEDRSFSIARSFDFLVLNDDLLALNKSSFESLLSYKAEYSNSFVELQKEPDFAQRFTCLKPLIAHVGTNAMHLRRMAVVQQRGHYKDAGYMARLQEVNLLEGWKIEFDADGKIVATEATMKAIMQVLLNHRLYSRLSLTTFDVPSATTL